MNPEALLLYDDTCAFCRWTVAKLLAWDRAERLRPLRIQSPAAQRLLEDIEPEQRLASWHLVTGEGCLYSAGAATAPLLRLLPGGRPLARLATAFSNAAERAYRLVADNRRHPGRLIPRAAKERAVRRIAEREEANGPLAAAVRPCR